MSLVSSCSCLFQMQWSQALIREWRCSWSSTDRRCSNYIWVIDNFIAYKGASYIRDLTVLLLDVFRKHFWLGRDVFYVGYCSIILVYSSNGWWHLFVYWSRWGFVGLAALNPCGTSKWLPLFWCSVRTQLDSCMLTRFVDTCICWWYGFYRVWIVCCA